MHDELENYKIEVDEEKENKNVNDIEHVHFSRKTHPLVNQTINKHRPTNTYWRKSVRNIISTRI